MKFGALGSAWWAILIGISVLAVKANGEEIFSIFGATPPIESSSYSTPLDAGEAAAGGSIAKRARHTRAEASPISSYCVRTCDGRYFPAPPGDNSSQAEACQNFCPSSEMKPYFGSNIERASDATGKLYSKLTNAFRYRTELVENCTCNGTNAGLSRISIDQDPTLRAGDLIVGEKGRLVASRGRGDSESNFRDSMASMKHVRQRTAKE